jgi:hypothetical protein
VTSAPLTPTSTSTTFPGGLLINEIVTNPRDVKWHVNGDEPLEQAQWLELYNSSGDSLCLANWWITTADQRQTAPFSSSQCIGPRQYLVVFRADLGVDLARAPIRLLDPGGRVADSVSPPALAPDYGYARIPDGSPNWTVTSGPTLRSANVLPPDPTATPDLQATAYAIQTQLASPLSLDDDSPDATDASEPRRPKAKPRRGQVFQELAIWDIRGLPDDTAVITTGVVTMPTGMWEIDRAYIQANGAGILIHSYGGTPLGLGDRLTIRGRVHHIRGEVEIAAVKGGELVTPGGALPPPRVAAPNEIGPATEALLVQVAGRVDEIEREYATVADDGGSARVFLYDRLGFARASLRGVTSVTITGVVNASEGRAAELGTRSYAQRLLVSTHRLVPRLAGDINIRSGAATAAAQETGAPGAEPARSRTQGQPESSTRGSVAASVAAPTAFVTPAFSSGRPAAARPQPATAPPNVLVLGSRAAELPWLWIGVALGALLLAGGGIAAIFGPRWFGHKEDG